MRALLRVVFDLPVLGAPQPLAGLALLHLVKLDVGHIAVVEEKRFSVFLSAEFDAISSTRKSIKTVPIIEKYY